MLTYKVLDNVIPNATQKRIYDIVTGRDFSWNIMKDSTYAPGINVPNFWNPTPTISFIREVYSYGDIVTIKMLPWCLQILDSALDKEDMVLEELFRIQVNLLYNSTNKNYEAGKWTTAHVDQDIDHQVLLYYVNDSDGDTFMFNEKRGDEFTEFTEMVRVQPKSGRALLFDGKYFHSASNPINSNKRLAINFNFKARKKDGPNGNEVTK
jgi:hypothetical protein